MSDVQSRAWDLVHEAHLSCKPVLAQDGAVRAYGVVVEIGNDYFVIEANRRDLRFSFEGTEVSYA